MQTLMHDQDEWKTYPRTKEEIWQNVLETVTPQDIWLLETVLEQQEEINLQYAWIDNKPINRPL